MAGLQKMVSDIKIGSTGKAILIDKNGSYLAGVEDDKIMKENISDDKDLGMTAVSKQLLSGDTGECQFNNTNGLNFAYYKTIPETNWVIVLT